MARPEKELFKSDALVELFKARDTLSALSVGYGDRTDLEETDRVVMGHIQSALQGVANALHEIIM